MRSPRLIRLESDFQQLRQMFDGHPSIRVQPMGPQPYQRYRVAYHVPSLRLDPKGRPTVSHVTEIDFELPASYPKDKPRAVATEEVFHPNFSSWVCIADFWSPAQSLADIFLEVGEMLQWQKYNVQSPLSAPAADWAVNHRSELPVGTINLRALVGSPVGEATSIRENKIGG